jgi:hypothetical protein
MAFDTSLDKELWSESLDFERSVIKVAVMSYNEGDKKVALIRQNKRADGELGFAKLGRLTQEEAEKVIPLMQKALEQF